MLNPTLMCDFYKLSHREQYPEGTEFVYSTLVPRSNKYYEHSDNIVVFGIQSLVKKYFIDMFNKEFFNRPKEEVINEYKRTVKFTLGHENPEAKHLEQLYDLGYLPIDVRALKEGTVVHPNTPIMTIENTHSDFFWLTNYLETIISTQTWQAMTSATLAYDMRKMLDKYALETVGNTEAVDFQGHDFSMRGMSSLETTQLSSAGHAISFKGSDTVPVVDFLESYYNADVEKEIVVASIPACYDKDTEILTETGWKLFNDLEEGEKVAQYYEDGSIDFVVPTEYYNMHYKGTMIHFTSKDKGNKGYVDFKVTPNHRMIKKLNKDNSIQIVEAQDKNVYSGRNKVVVSGKSSVKGSKLTAMDRLKIAFQADGSFMNRKDSYNGKHSNGEKPIRFSLKKDRKKERLVELLDELGIYYTLSKYENGYYSFYIKSSEEFRKDFDWVNLSSISYEWADEFIQELKFWDGKQSSKNTITYSTIVKRNIDKVQAIGHLAEYKGLITEYDDLRNDSDRQLLYSITFTKNKTSIGGSIVTKHEVEYDDTVHCVSVPTKMLVVRRNDVVGVSGNTEHSVMCANGNYETMDEYETYKRMLTEIYPTGIFSIVSDTWDFWGNMTKTLPRLKDIIMERDGKITVRPDSGNPVKIICGDPDADTEYERKGAVEVLWDTFGGTETEKGYKVLDEHVGLIYGDSINYERAHQICEGLKEKGFASINVVLGVGSFSYQFNTRDTHGFAIKATYAKIKNEEKLIYKNPKTDSGKRSHKGRVAVYKDGSWEDNLNLHQWLNKQNLNQLERVFEDGKLYRDQSLSEIREIIKNN